MEQRSWLATVALNIENRIVLVLDDGETWWEIYSQTGDFPGVERGDRLCITTLPPRPPENCTAVWQP